MNSKAVVTFNALHQDFQEYGSTEEHMVSRVFFDVTYEARTLEDAYCEVKQPAAGDFRADPLEVRLPPEYKGPRLNWEQLSKRVESYYRAQISIEGSAIRLPKGGHERMKKNVIIASESVEIEIGDPTIPAW